jgi:3-deoxy-D-manno-octulosonic-acid transferase
LKTKGIYFLYRALQAFGLPALLLYFAARGVRNRGYWRSLAQRLGFLPHSFRQTGPGAIWLHAVSVGEVLSCVELLRRVRAEFPRTHVFVSTTTLAGRATAGEKLRGLADGIFYAPVDYVWAVRRVLRIIQPSVVVIAETEIWPNLFREVKRTAAALVIVNGRISDRAWPRYAKLEWLFRTVLPQADEILVQSEAIRDRFAALGAPAGRLCVAGNFKYDFEARAASADSPVAAWLRSRPGKVWVAASTMPPAESGDPDEDDLVVDAFREVSGQIPHLLLILAPRKPERFDVAAAKLDAAGIGYLRRSALAGGTVPQARVLLLDTIGELSGLFAFADVVFMGGTVARRGGHNILEPAFFGKPVIAGPHMENFQAISDEFRAAGAYVEIGRGYELAGAVRALLEDAEKARTIGARARVCAEARRGATSRAVARIRALYDGGIPHYRPAMPLFSMRWLLSRVWEWGGRAKQARDLKRRRALDVPVVSVGNLTMGGTGKTPCVLRLAELLRACGRTPGILTRGYGRSSVEKHLTLAPGAAVHSELSGDEPQIFVRSGIAPVGIGGNRFETGRGLRRQFNVDVMLLDDGFQHLRLARDLDIVLIDALNPFGGGELFPLGRLREPLGALTRAGIIVITRTGFSDAAAAVEHEVRKFNPEVPVFHAKVRPEAWIENRTGKCYSAAEPPFERAGAFCGVGNPLSFRRTLEALGVEPVEWVQFNDHHRYRPDELRRMAQQAAAAGASALVTTEKDTMNLCDGCDDLVAPLPLYWLKVSMAFDREAELIAEIERRIKVTAP